MVNSTGGSLSDGSLTIAATQRTFDMDKESDVLSLLKIVHQNPLDPAIKNHLRDLIFAYEQSLTPKDLKKVQEGFAPFNIHIVVTTEVVSATPANQLSSEKDKPQRTSLGITRPQPVFKTAVLETKPRVIRTVKEGEGVVMPTLHKELAQKASEEPAQPLSTAPIAAEAVPEPVAVPTPQASAPEPAAPVQMMGDPTERIKEIKRLVNEKVGNPVNLIETHNELGREYMAALLDAMKKANGGASGGIGAAMERLEKAFKQVQDEVLSSPEPLQKAVPQQPPAAAPKKEEAPVVKVEPEVVPQDATPSPAPVIEKKAPSIPAPVHAEEQSTPTPAPVERAPRPEEQRKSTSMPSVREQLSRTEPSFVQRPPQQEHGMHSVAKEKQLQDLLRANREKEVLTEKQKEEARVAAMDPLMAPDVDDGLSQLLLEWDLFKKSGFLGTGPKGREHPLFKKLAPLTMAAVIAGRFEGSATAIKQDIADTMNGWRYAEGVVHEHGETFEHYLRRVVRHILIRQNRK